MVYYNPDNPDTTYRSQGVHKNRDTTAKMEVDAIDRDGVSDSQKQKDMATAAAEATAQTVADDRTKIAVDERINTRPQKDVGTEVRRQGHKAVAAHVSTVDAPGYNPPMPGKGTRASFGNEGTQQNPAPEGEGISMDMGSMMGGGGGGGEGGGGGGEGGGGGGEGGGGYSGGGGGGGMMGGLPEAIGSDTASIDDEIDRATNTLFEDDSARIAAERMGEKLQGR